MGLGAMPSYHPNFISMPGMHGSYAANMGMTETDLMIALGVRFDDLHRSGGAMLELIAALLQQAGAIRLLVVLAGRPDQRWLQTFPAASVLRLEPLDPGSAAMVDQVPEPQVAQLAIWVLVSTPAAVEQTRIPAELADEPMALVRFSETRS